MRASRSLIHAGWAVVYLALALTPCWAQDAFVPNQKPSIQVPRIEGAVHVDGELDEPMWSKAVRANNFTEFKPGDQTKPPVETEVLLAYDTNNLYLGFIAHDDPSTVRSSLRDRDQIFSDDWIGIFLDTYGDAAWAYELVMNPLGVQGDLRWTPNDEDVRFDIVFASRGKITAEGYQVEVAIPFSSLRFPDRAEQSWRVTFIRTQPRDSRRQYSWATISRDEPCFPCQFGTLEGISGVRRATSLELLPSVTGSQFAERDIFEPGASLDSDKADADVGLGIRYSLTSSLTADATINPDFSQVEADAAQIDVNTTFALFYPERRPFFQEGGDLFDTWISAVYTRSINDPAGAVKLTGRQGRTSIGYIGGRDEHTPVILPFEERSDFLLAGRSYSNILRIKQTFQEDSFLGMLATDQRLSGGGSGTLLGGDSSYRFKKNYRIEAQGIASRTVEPTDSTLSAEIGTGLFDDGTHTAAFDGEDFWGHAVYASVERDARRLNFDLDYWETSPTFRAPNGFVTQNDSRRSIFWLGSTFQSDTRVWEEIQPNFSVGRVWNFDGEFKDEWFNPGIFMRLKKQIGVRASYLFSNEQFQGDYFGGIRRGTVEMWCDGSERVQPGFYVASGRFIARRENPPVLGDGVNVSGWATLKPFQRFVIEPEYAYSQLRYPDSGPFIFTGYILRSRFSYQFTRELFARLVLQYDNFDDAFAIDPLLTYKINPFTAFYAGSTHDFTRLDPASGSTDMKQTQRQYFAKLQYLFRI